MTTVKPGDEVVVHSGWWEPDDPWVLSAATPCWRRARGSGAIKPTTEAIASTRAPGAPMHPQATAADLGNPQPPIFFALRPRIPHADGLVANVVEKGDVVLVWGAAGGLGSLALQIAREAGGRPVAVVSDPSKRQFCLDHGAVGVINRNDFNHWGKMPDTNDKGYGEWVKGARAFGKAIWDAVGEKVSPRIVFEHPGETTLPTSCFVCSTGGMVVICAGTTGYNVTLDLRYHWMRQKRLQGSHLSNDEQAAAVTRLVAEGRIDPCLSRTFSFDQIGEAHQLMHDNMHPSGNMAALVNATAAGQGAR